MDPKHLRGYGLSVNLNGSVTKLMLHTGASGIVANSRLAERAGITKITEMKGAGVGDKGTKNAFVGTADSIRIGELEFQNCPVRVVESRSVAGEDGLVGADIFEDFLVEVNFPGEELRLSELPKPPGQADRPLSLKNEEDDLDNDESATSTDNSGKIEASKKAPQAASSGPQDRYLAPEMRSYAQVFRFGHQLLVPTKVGDAPVKLFLLDTWLLQIQFHRRRLGK